MDESLVLFASASAQTLKGDDNYVYKLYIATVVLFCEVMLFNEYYQKA